MIGNLIEFSDSEDNWPEQQHQLAPPQQQQSPPPPPPPQELPLQHRQQAPQQPAPRQPASPNRYATVASAFDCGLKWPIWQSTRGNGNAANGNAQDDWDWIEANDNATVNANANANAALIKNGNETGTAANEIKNKRLHVSNIPFKYKREHLAKLFAEFGVLTDSEIIYNERGSKGFGFVSFMKADDACRAKMAKDRTIVEGRQIEVNYATPRPKHSSSSSCPSPRRSTHEHAPRLSPRRATQNEPLPQWAVIGNVPLYPRKATPQHAPISPVSSSSAASKCSYDFDRKSTRQQSRPRVLTQKSNYAQPKNPIKWLNLSQSYTQPNYYNCPVAD